MTCFRDGVAEIGKRKTKILCIFECTGLPLHECVCMWKSVCVFECVFMSFCGHVCVLCRINNLDGSAAGEDTVQSWLKLLAAASQREENMRGR